MSYKPALYGDGVRWGLVHADALDLFAELPPNSVDVVLTDPPYAIDFANEAWDGVDIRRVAAEGGGRLSAGEAFARWTQTWAAECQRLLRPGGHLLAFGAPRTAHRLVCGVEDAGLEVRDMLAWLYATGVPKSRRLPGGLATGLKPAYEPILLARAPFSGRVADNLIQWGTGALNIDVARIGAAGFWPANVVLSHAAGCSKRRCVRDCPARLVDAARPDKPPSRLFFSAKATRREREAGCEQLPQRSAQLYRGRPGRRVRNIHPTVKPIGLMRHLVRLVCPPGGVVLDPFTGSGSTGAATMLEGRQFLGIEREAEYVRVARARLAYWARVAARSTR
ncbi:MAG TPA: site-specific DNA-methyltransferase [Solirubrobacteraceae bacterium]|jgi:site-specific DNA-methyltransferase (adenine-specific)